LIQINCGPLACRSGADHDTPILRHFDGSIIKLPTASGFRHASSSIVTAWTAEISVVVRARVQSAFGVFGARRR
jgi:hypothetical protein